MLNVRRLTLASTAAALAVVLSAGTATAAEPETITPADSAATGADWNFSNVHTTETGATTVTGGAGRIAEAPAGGSFGSSSALLEVADATEKARLETTLLNEVPLSALEGATYSTHKDGVPGYAPSVNVMIDPEGDDDFATLVWEANKAGFTIAENTWQSWDTLAGKGWWSPSITTAGQPGRNGTPTDLDTLVTHFGDESRILGFAVNVGRHGAMTAYVDGIGITVDGVTTVYDVEPHVPTTDDCRNGGWVTNFEAGQFKNQGQCVSSFSSSKAAAKK